MLYNTYNTIYVFSFWYIKLKWIRKQSHDLAAWALYIYISQASYSWVCSFSSVIWQAAAPLLSYSSFIIYFNTKTERSSVASTTCRTDPRVETKEASTPRFDKDWRGSSRHGEPARRGLVHRLPHQSIWWIHLKQFRIAVAYSENCSPSSTTFWINDSSGFRRLKLWTIRIGQSVVSCSGLLYITFKHEAPGSKPQEKCVDLLLKKFVSCQFPQCWSSTL